SSNTETGSTATGKRSKTIKGSAVVEHSSQCSLDLRPKIICRESLFSLRKLKEAFYIRHNAPSMNRDKGVETTYPFRSISALFPFFILVSSVTAGELIRLSELIGTRVSKPVANTLQLRIFCHETNLRLRWIKEALYMRKIQRATVIMVLK
ncbi:hypothetical protein M513_08443, partial [Trichuris suis]